LVLFKLLNDNKKWLEVVVAITGGKLKECPSSIQVDFITSLRIQSTLKGHHANPANNKTRPLLILDVRIKASPDEANAFPLKCALSIHGNFDDLFKTL
jgi:hypothetical protein